MAINLYGTVYFRDSVAGTLQQVPDGRYAFTYERTYIESGQPQIAYTLPRALAPQYTRAYPHFSTTLSQKAVWRARVAHMQLTANRLERYWPIREDIPIGNRYESLYTSGRQRGSPTLSSRPIDSSEKAAPELNCGSGNLCLVLCRNPGHD